MSSGIERRKLPDVKKKLLPGKVSCFNRIVIREGNQEDEEDEEDDAFGRSRSLTSGGNRISIRFLINRMAVLSGRSSSGLTGRSLVEFAMSIVCVSLQSSVAMRGNLRSNWLSFSNAGANPRLSATAPSGLSKTDDHKTQICLVPSITSRVGHQAAKSRRN